MAIRNFRKAFKDGRAFCYLLLSENPEAISEESIEEMEPEKRLKLAFEVAKDCFGVEPILDVEEPPRVSVDTKR